MSDDDVLTTAGDLRVRLEHDPYPAMPYDDGMAPIIALYRVVTPTVQQLTDLTSYQVPDTILAAAERWQDQPDVLERYLRIFHGTTVVQWYTNAAEYLAFDTKDWRDAMGITDLARLASEDLFADFRAFCEGDVWSWVLEEQVTWERVTSVDDPDLPATRLTWEEVSSCSGIYGRKYAEESATESLNDEIHARDWRRRPVGTPAPMPRHDPDNCTLDFPCAYCQNQIYARED